MAKSDVILLLACFLLSTITGLAYAQESPITLTTNETAYSPGDTVYVTVTSNNPIPCIVANQLYMLCLRIVILPVPTPTCSYSCPTASATLHLMYPAYNTNGYAGLPQGKVAVRLPDNTSTGDYDVGILLCTKWVINGNQISCGGQPIFYQSATITIIVRAGIRTEPVPEGS